MDVSLTTLVMLSTSSVEFMLRETASTCKKSENCVMLNAESLRIAALGLPTISRANPDVAARYVVPGRDATSEEFRNKRSLTVNWMMTPV